MSSESYVEEACYYLSELRLKPEEIAKLFNISSDQVTYAVKQYAAKVASGEASFEEETQKFWSLVLRENSGDEKITLVDDKGRYYHGWRTELEKLPTEDLVELLVVNKRYSDRHPLSEFSKAQPIVGYDPLVPLRNIRKTVSFIDEILQKRASREVEEEQSDEKPQNEATVESKRAPKTRSAKTKRKKNVGLVDLPADKKK